MKERKNGWGGPGSKEIKNFGYSWTDGKIAAHGVKIKAIRMAVMTILCMGTMVAPSNAKSAVQASGDISQIIIPVTAYASTFIVEDDEGRKEFYESFALNLGVTYGLKLSIDKKRPDGGSRAFPSGHTSVSFQGATFIQRRYGWKFGIPSYLAATYVGWSRIDSDKHDLSDVLTGAAIGIASSYLFTTPFKGVTVSPLIDDDAVGLTFTVKW